MSSEFQVADGAERQRLASALGAWDYLDQVRESTQVEELFLQSLDEEEPVVGEARRVQSFVQSHGSSVSPSPHSVYNTLTSPPRSFTAPTFNVSAFQEEAPADPQQASGTGTPFVKNYWRPRILRESSGSYTFGWLTRCLKTVSVCSFF